MLDTTFIISKDEGDLKKFGDKLDGDVILLSVGLMYFAEEAVAKIL